ncbi:hypothetical protein [Pontibacter sp. G13]|uniref:hypothetical protein n=1 Tax=Pontibacter sp. G13 TaxID=3074898 RepID=UPI00288A5176|nr:hypothetical protein [Pontibacter sp. G13]WNJ20249.1 hypothetical protein RJD25_07200 [Pontibacter sp. G13]
MRRLSLFFLFFCLGFGAMYAQGYTTAVGVRLGNSYGLSVVQRVLPQVSVEGLLQSTFDDRTYLHVLAKGHNKVISRKFNIYYGGGAHFGLNRTLETSRGLAGIDGILGIEATFGRLNCSWDFKPQVDWGANGTSFVGNTALSLRYVIVKSNAFKRKKKKKKSGTNEAKTGTRKKPGRWW